MYNPNPSNPTLAMQFQRLLAHYEDETGHRHRLSEDFCRGLEPGRELPQEQPKETNEND